MLKAGGGDSGQRGSECTVGGERARWAYRPKPWPGTQDGVNGAWV